MILQKLSTYFVVFTMFILSIVHKPVCGQTKEIDSLQRVLKTLKGDSNKVNTLNYLSARYIYVSNYERAWELAYQSKLLAQVLNFKKGLAEAVDNLALTYDYQGVYSKALDYYFMALKIKQSIKNDIGIATTYANIGTVYELQGNYSAALKLYSFSIKMFQKTHDDRSTAMMYNNIGNIYYKIKNYPEALTYYTSSLKIKERIKDQRGIASSYINIATIYMNQNKLDSALLLSQKSLKIFQAILDDEDAAVCYYNIGNIYSKQNKYNESIENYMTCLNLNKKIGSKSGIISALITLGKSNFYTNNIKQAKVYIKEGLSLAKEQSMKMELRDCYETLYMIDSIKGNDKAEYENYKLFIAYSDSLKSEEITQELNQKKIQAEFDKKEYALKAEQAKKDAIKNQELRIQRFIRNGFTIGLVLLLLFFFVLFRNYQKKKQTNKQLLFQKKEIEAQTQSIETQTTLIEGKQKEIEDSIHYARRIQQSILTSEADIKKIISQFFILYQPKDIVSGDFYWATASKDQSKFIIATADCTGHGVPGAFMSMLGVNFLNDTIIKRNITQPDLALNQLRNQIINSLNTEYTQGETKDGMDCVLYSIDLNTLELQYAAANNSFYIIRNKELIECKADKMPVGKYHGELIPFTLRTFQLQKGDLIYTFTDGYADQFGGPKGKKFKYKALEELLVKNSHLSIDKQKEVLAEQFEIWKGELEQVDDVLVLGVRI